MHVEKRSPGTPMMATAPSSRAHDDPANIPVGILVCPVVKQCSPGGQHPTEARGFPSMAAMAGATPDCEARQRFALAALSVCARARPEGPGPRGGAGDRAQGCDATRGGARGELTPPTRSSRARAGGALAGRCRVG